MHATARTRTLGSIPACAGEPFRRPGSSIHDKVYPRVCGGTKGATRGRLRCYGLSPRVRGNHSSRVRSSMMCRSIPACAGEPTGRRTSSRPARVYPRVCGGTVPRLATIRPTYGLSPRVRGNQGALTAHDYQRRSIPACAGEPAPAIVQDEAVVVYPRVCGGTITDRILIADCAGLSPRVRGNPKPAGIAGGRLWSIPACAGEPLIAVAQALAQGVYPRVCGGTRATTGCHHTLKGLSPRVRGNPRPRSNIAG